MVVAVLQRLGRLRFLRDGLRHVLLLYKARGTSMRVHVRAFLRMRACVRAYTKLKDLTVSKSQPKKLVTSIF